uniref:Uridylate-specific endoribonuclease n=1 Tax=Schistocephalus solidus TaxID=70667 RepID=A0A183T5M3_SCHSO
LDNYKADVGMSETETEAERREQDTFLNRLIERPVIKEVHKYLVSIHLAPADREGFKRLLRNVCPNDSSAFEHVFLGEKNKGKVSGFHNWFVFCDQEANGDIDYHGFYRSFKNQPEGNFKRTLRFKWKNLMKEKSTLLFGASVEFELGLYTTIYLISKQSQKWRCVPVQIGQVRTCVQCYDHKGHMGTCFAM